MSDEWRPQWRDIATAPEDTGILVTDGKVVTAYKIISVGGDRYLTGYGCSGYEWEPDLSYGELTHWMPLPGPPSEVSKDTQTEAPRETKFQRK